MADDAMALATPPNGQTDREIQHEGDPRADEIRICPETGATLHRGVRSMTLTYENQSETVEMPGWYGEGVADGIHSGIDMKVSDRALYRMRARAERLLLPDEIRQIRQRLRLSQRAAGALLGGGPNAFQKYEAGDLMPSRAICSALLLLDRDPAGMAALKARYRHAAES